MNYRQFAKSYKSVSVQTASPGKLVLMLYDGCLRFMAAAIAEFEGDDPARYQEVHNNLIKAQNIITELQACLDMNVEGDFPVTMYRLYDYMQGQLQEANIKKTPEPVRTVQRLLKDIRDAWAEMLTKQEGGAPKQPLTSLSGSA